MNQLTPVNELGLAELEKLAKKAQVITVDKGFVFEASEEYRWLLYLKSGYFELTEKNKPKSEITTGSARAHLPFFCEQAHHISAIAKEPSTIVRFDRQYFHTLLKQAMLDGEQVETIEINETESHLFNTIMHAFNQGLLNLPSLPEVALKIKEAVSDPTVTPEMLVRILEADPVVAARLIQVANSPIKRGVSPVQSIRAAVIRLGYTTTRDLVICLAVKQLFTAKSPILMERMKKLYEHSTEVAAIAYILAKKTTHLEADELLLAGLVHDIGVIPILAYIDQTGLVIENIEQVEEIVIDLRTVVGSMVISSWSLSPELITVIENAENWSRTHAGEADMCDVILASQIYFKLQHHQLKDVPALDKVPAFTKLFPDHQNPELIKEILEQAKEEVDEVKRLLNQ